MAPAPTHWDLAVVGAGPAGAATALGALRADPDLRVVLLDQADFPRDKACGDGVAPHVLDLLAKVDVTGLVDDRVPVDHLRLGRGGGGRPSGGWPARCGWYRAGSSMPDWPTRPSPPAPDSSGTASVICGSTPTRWSWTGRSPPRSWSAPTAPTRSSDARSAGPAVRWP
ncbi:hypothetical protein SHIRM173S_02228 [Streptomyces hirsutus]